MVDHLDIDIVLWGIAITTISYWVGAGFYALIPALFPRYAARYKLQTNSKPMPTKTHIGLMLLTLFNQTVIPFFFFTVPIGLYFALGGRLSLEWPAWYMVLFHFLMYALIFEIMFYASHRFLHTKRMYKWIHSVHHKFRAPVPYSAACVHPVEFVMSYLLPNTLAALLFSFSVPEYFLFISFEYVHTVHDHCGYHYPWDPFAIVFGQNSRVHDEHHRLNKVNYSGAFTMVLDRIFGTFHDPDAIAKVAKTDASNPAEPASIQA